MRTIRTIPELREHLAEHRRAGRSVGLVPTMGFFHQGHLALMAAARENTDVVVVSLFVNPTQFGPAEDLDAYPRDEARDASLAEGVGVDVLFAPDRAEVYPAGFATSVTVAGITEVLCGDPRRRGAAHFSGVTQVVAKLFNIVGPDVAFFGQKDAQQALVVRRMAADLNFPVRIEVLPTIREADGLAMSSRNSYLSADERQQATALSRGLDAAEAAFVGGERSAEALVRVASEVLDNADIDIEYVELRAVEDLSELRTVDVPGLLAMAARVGRTRLIDNRILETHLPEVGRADTAGTQQNGTRP
ncbi:pantoate--beta-alanine ligase [Nakamurella silvestris]|nr:pantoate--beta-alanine ligase [Nakamurella silvestris]